MREGFSGSLMRNLNPTNSASATTQRPHSKHGNAVELCRTRFQGWETEAATQGAKEKVGAKGQDGMLDLPVRLSLMGTASISPCIDMLNKFSCSTRHIKCDEGKPSCKRCISAKRECHGTTENSASPAWQKLADAPVMLLIQQPDPYVAPPSVTLSAEAREAMHLFHTNVLHQMANIFDTQFWTIQVPRATQAYPTIWHASLALTAMYRRCIGPESAVAGDETFRERLYKLSLKHYGAAMTHLVQIAQQDRLDHGDKETLLLSTVLFTGICRLQEDLSEALAHIRNGLKMFRLWHMWNANPTAGILSVRSLVALFNQFQQFLGFERGTLDSESVIRENTPESAAQPFLSMTEAYLEFEHLQVGGSSDNLPMAKLASSGCLDVGFARAAHLAALGVWESKFSELQKTQQLDTIDMQLAMLLQLRLYCAKMKLAIESGKDLLCWDEFQPEFEEMIEIARALLTGMKGRASSMLPPGASFTPSMSWPLYFIAAGCRNFSIRRDAIALLKQCPRSEGTWDIALAVAIAEARMRLEEDAVLAQSSNPWCACISGAFVCAGHRVMDIHGQVLEKQRAKVTLRTAHDAAQGHTGTLVALHW